MPPRVGRVAIDRDLEHSHANTRYRRYARVVGLAAVFFGRQQAVARHFGCSIDFVRYHNRKAVDPTYHAGRWGGSQGAARFASQAAAILESVLWQEVRADPIRTSAEIVLAMRTNGFAVTRRWVELRFRRWGFTRQQPSYLNLNKFTATNIFYYG